MQAFFRFTGQWKGVKRWQTFLSQVHLIEHTYSMQRCTVHKLLVGLKSRTLTWMWEL